MARGWRKNSNFDRSNFGQRIRAARTLLGLSFRDLARATGINPGTLKNVEDGLRDLPQTEFKPHCRRVIEALEAEARRQPKHLDSEGLWMAAGWPPPTRMSRRRVVARGTAAATAAVLTASPEASIEGHSPEVVPEGVSSDRPEQSPRQRYDGLMAEADRLSDIQQYTQATLCYEQAVRVARDANLLEAEAFAVARQAYSLRRRSELAAGWQLSTVALERLGAVDLAPEHMVSSSQIHARATSDLWLQAYTMVTRVRGHIADDQEEFGTAKAAFATLGNVGAALGDDRLRAHAEFFVGRLLVSAGTDLGEGEEYRRVVNPAMVEAGLRRIREALKLRRDGDPLWEGHGLYQELKAMWLLKGKSSAATRVEKEALAAFGDRPAVANLYLSKGWLEIVDDDLAAEGHFERALTLGWEIGSAGLVSGALGALAELHAQSWTQSTSWHQEKAIDHCLAALGLWPSSTDARDFRRMSRLFDDLEVSAWQVRDALEQRRGPLERAAETPEFTHRLRTHLGLLGVRFQLAVGDSCAPV